MFLVIYGDDDTPPQCPLSPSHGGDGVTMPFSSSAASPQRSFSLPYGSNTDSDDNDGIDDSGTSSQWSMSHGPPSWGLMLHHSGR